MKKQLAVLILTALLAVSFNQSIGKQESTDDVFGLPDPTLVFIYPENFQNGSSFPVGEYLYFTMTGNLSLFNYPDTYFDLFITFDSGSYFSPTYHEGYGTWVIEPQKTVNLAIDEWHILNINMSWNNETNGYPVYSLASNMSLFASSEYFAEDLSLTPVNYPNNSIIPLANVKHMSERQLPLFKATGWKKGEMTDIPFMDGAWEDVPIGSSVDATYVWDNGDSWNNLSMQEPSYYYHNEFLLKPVDLDISEGLHTLTIKIENDTHAQNTTFMYTFTQPQMDFERWYFGADALEGDMHFLSANRNVILQSFESSGLNVPKSVIYNWNDGSGNNTLTGNSTLVPEWNVSYAGEQALSYWIQMENYTQYDGNMIDGTIWSEEYRIGFTYEHIQPQINLDYPVNDTGKSGIIPLIWNLDTENGGWWNYSGYEFNIYYETDLVPQTLAKSSWTPITEYTHQAQHKETSWYYKSAFHMYHKSSPALYSFEFNLTEAMDTAGIGSSTMRNLQESSQIRFIIEETTTQTVYNESELAGSGASSYAMCSSSSEEVNSVITDWIYVFFGGFVAQAPLPGAGVPSGEPTTYEAPIPFGSPFLILMGIIVLSMRKRRQH